MAKAVDLVSAAFDEAWQKANGFRKKKDKTKADPEGKGGDKDMTVQPGKH